MNCQEFWNALPRQGRNATPEQASHVAECPACAAQWEQHRSLAAGLRYLAEELRRVEAPPRVEAGVTAAFRSGARFQDRRSARLSRWTPVFAWASTAAAMAALAFSVLRTVPSTAVKPGTVAAPHHAAQPVVQWAAAETPAAADADQDEDSAGLGDGFIRLPNATRIEPNEDVNVVRVEVTGSAMIAMGLPVSEDRASETLLADVALGPDGMARAVRFVNDGGTF
jgi:anti-sigma factor RsiW